MKRDILHISLLRKCVITEGVFTASMSLTTRMAGDTSTCSFVSRYFLFISNANLSKNTDGHGADSSEQCYEI